MKRLTLLARLLNFSFSFDQICVLAEKAGFVLRKQAGSHMIYNHPGCKEIINLQRYGDKAKSYQVKKLVNVIDKYCLIKENKNVPILSDLERRR